MYFRPHRSPGPVLGSTQNALQLYSLVLLYVVTCERWSGAGCEFGRCWCSSTVGREGKRSTVQSGLTVLVKSITKSSGLRHVSAVNLCVGIFAWSANRMKVSYLQFGTVPGCFCDRDLQLTFTHSPKLPSVRVFTLHGRRHNMGFLSRFVRHEQTPQLPFHDFSHLIRPALLSSLPHGSARPQMQDPACMPIFVCYWRHSAYYLLAPQLPLRSWNRHTVTTGRTEVACRRLHTIRYTSHPGAMCPHLSILAGDCGPFSPSVRDSVGCFVDRTSLCVLVFLQPLSQPPTPRSALLLTAPG